MKKVLVLIILLFSTMNVFADTTATTTQPVPMVQFSECYKTYAKPAEPVFYLVLSAISKNNYKVKEVQSKNGLILFNSGNKDFFVNITQIDVHTTMVKIIPADNSYSFQYEIIDNIFKSIVADMNTPIYKLN